MELGDVLIDGDIIIRDKYTLEMIGDDTHDLLYSFYEQYDYITNYGKNEDTYVKLLQKLDTITYSEPYMLPNIKELGWPNASMTRFTNQELKDKYIEQYQNHVQKLYNIDFETIWPDIIIEQYFLRLLCEKENYTFHPFIPNFPTPESNEYSCSIKFTHLGGAKKAAQEIVENWLKNGNKDIYTNTLNEINKYIANPKLLY